MLAREELEAAGGDAAAAPGGDAAAAPAAPRHGVPGGEARGAWEANLAAIGGEPAPAWEGGQRSASPSDATASDGDDAPRGPRVGPPPTTGVGRAVADDGAIPAGLEDVERRSNCTLEAIAAALCYAPTFRRHFDRKERERQLASASASLRRAIEAKDAAAERHGGIDGPGRRAFDAAIDDLRAALADGSKDARVARELGTGGAHLDVAEVFGVLVDEIGRTHRGESPAAVLRTKGRIAQAACAACGASNGEKPIKLSELARSATASAIVHAAKTGRARSLEDVYREAHRHAGKSCDACGAPGACAVVHDLDKVAKALVLSVAWFSTYQDAGDVRALLGLAAKSLDARRCFEDATPKEPAVRKLHLVAMVTFKDNHYTAFVKDKHGHWTWHDKAEATACRGWKDVVDRCCKTKGAPMLPYLLLYDNPVEVPPAAR
ncbi:hypothetical protein SO694_00177040 [Aureococcus anophagefferens]|uniref:USP domain-containing protein n=1 Tax=Aureococcus anophagefferens TaxID=44056 RepID=A0ABR1FGQ6_AURAN